MPLDHRPGRTSINSPRWAVRPPRSLTPEQMRAVTLERRRRFGSPAAGGCPDRDHTIPGPDGDVPIQVYLPDAPARCRSWSYHGGGWVRGCVETHEGVCRAWPT